ncbi:MAG: cyclase family protein [Phycisphaerales bacterium]|nr:cyclase family protein [Phycisphaerales bacterium]
MIYDITPVVSTRTNVWPGDTPLSREMVCDMASGANVTLSAVRSTLHLGAHADGPNHYSHPAPGVGERSLAYFLGLCQVIDAPVPRGTRVRPQDLKVPRGRVEAPRVLIRTGTFPDVERWNHDFSALSPELIEFLAAADVSAGDPSVAPRGVVTVGVDTPSVDPQESKDLPAHKAIARYDMQIIEGLALAGVPAGLYELIALPLRLVGWDASPVRAVLRTR